ncbi:telomere-associated protein RIF1 isoform X1 [Oncorhynchus tshawytscha]|uniref:Telomere-associated protein Rif1 N-terminal domain-containing protein n=1 Tax=Oncorhynchus tshawytscha TaxID=74940 RepID=A0A8C8HKC8_ONCTS|nr:telomere-associated protein RIF1 isoform X1 [Oncorhynchus tshawytscha]XP_024262812.1 telomere-associated protein RIF1 isoform X1 [Oncorhynchus tshawytscha]
MMAMVPPTSSGLLPLLESLEDSTAGQPEQTEAYLTIANRLSGDDGTQFLPAVVKHFPRLGKTFQTHISSQNAELSQAALQALGFCVFHVHVVSAISANFAEEILSALSSLVVKSTDKSTCTRALWVISKQNFPTEVVAKKVPEILRALECVRMREDIQSVVMEHESLNVVISLLEQASAQMGEDAVQWAKLVIPLVVHSASKVRLRAAAALEMGLPLLLEKQKEVAAILEPLMSSKLIPELQKLFSTKNETNVLKLWPLFVRLLGKLLHRGGPFINSLLGLEELGFRSSSPNIKKIAFIAWKSLIDNFALNPEILCSAKRLKLLLQPLSSIQVRTEALLLTKLEVWWYLVVKLGANLPAHFEQVGVPLLQCTLGPDSALPATPSRSSSQCSAVGTTTPKSGSPAFSGTMVPRLNLNTSVVVAQAYPSIQLLGLEMLLHYFLGSEVTTAAAKNKLTLSLEPISHPFLSSPFSFTKHAPLLITAVHDSFICIGKDAPDALLSLIWKNLVSFVSTTIDAAGNKKERQGSEVLTLLLQALQSIISSEALPANRALSLLELTVKGIPQRVLGSASYQVGKMDVLNGTPALFLILLFYNHSLVAGFVEDERFFLCLETLVSCGLSGPTSPLAFGEAVLAAVGCSAGTLENKEQLWRMWSLVVNPLTDTITQTNEVNQGDALEHNFSAVLTALMFPIIHLLPGKVLPQMTQKAMLGTWCGLYKVFARCSALVATAEENVCCEELCVKMAAILDRKALKVPSTLHAVANILLAIAESADFSPYTPQFQQKMKSPHTHLTWVRKKSKALGNLYTFQTLLVQSLETFNTLEAPETAPNGTGLALVSILSILFSNLSLGTAIQEALASLSHPLVALYEQAGRTPNEQRKCTSSLGAKLEKLLSDVLGCLQIRSALAYDDELLSLLSPLLCVLFLHQRKQVRSLATQFWNATFANTLVLVYPEELKPVLSQVKQNTPIILPGFQSVELPDELSGQYSSESSQLETKLSGVQVTSGVKRDSLLPRAEEIKDRNSKTSTKPVSTKLDFGSHKLPRREELEEQASIDFVFIPPETKERVLTEHQKEVKRTKRVDIPAMYNNLDASLDTTVFTQYTQSQEESLDKLPADEQAEDAAKDEVKAEGNVERDEASEVLTKDTQEYISPTNEMAEPAMEEEPPEEVLPESADVSMEDANEDVPLEDSDVAMESREEGTSPIVSGGSDIISGTPKKHNSRRQSFITLEKYAEGKPASPANVVKFTGPLTRTLNSQEQEPASQKPSAEIEADTDRQDSQETEQVRHKSSRNESFLKEGEEHESSENKKESEVEIITEKQSSETTEDDVFPGTETQVEVLKEVPVPAVEEVMGNNSQEEEESKRLLEDSTSSQSTLSQGEPRRSGRRRSRPLRPGEDTAERDDLDKQRKKSQPGEDVSQTDSPKTTPSLASPTDSQSQRRASRRSKLAVEEDGGKDKLRKRSHKELSQSNSQLATPSPAGDSNNLSQGWRSNKLVRESEELVKDKWKRRGVAKEELSQSDSLTVTASDNDSQSQSRRSQRSKLAVEVEDDGNQKRKGGRAQKEKPSQTDSHVAKPSQLESQSQGRTSRSKAVSDSEEFDLPDKVEKQDPTEEEQSQRDSQMATLSPATQTGDEQSQGISSGRSKLVTQSKEQGKDKQRRVGTENTLSQIDSKITTPSATPKDSQSQGRASRKSKVPLEVAELEDKTSPNVATDSAAAPEMSLTDSQVTPSATRQTDSQPRLRGRFSKRSKLEEQLKASSSPMPTPIETHSSQVADQAGTQESPQGSRRTTRRRASQGLLSSNVEESDTSETREDAQKHKKRGRNPKSTEALQSPLATVGSGEPGAYLEIPMDLSESSLKSESEKSDLQNPLTEALEVKIPQDVDETIKSINSLKPVMDVLKLPLITKNNMGQREDNTEMVDIEGECENTKLPSQLIDSSFKSDLEQLKSQHFCISPRKNLKTVSSQEGVHSDFGCEGPTQLQNKLLTDSEQANSPVPSADGNSFSGYESVLLEPNKLCTPPISNGLPTDTSPSKAAEEKLSLSLQVAESSGEKLVDVPKPVTVSSEEVTEEQMGEDKENRHPESTNNVLEEDQPEEDVFMSIVHTQPEGFNALDEEQQEEQYTCIKEGQPESDNTSTRTRENDTEPQANNVQDITPLQERAKMDTVPSLECEEEDGEETQLDNNDLALHPLDSVAPLTFDTREAPVPLHHPSTSKDVLCQDSPPKQKGLEAMMGLEVGQSPSSGRIRGMWTPSASPSTSILKKGQKRPIEEESSSPFTKSRRVSFADPIQHQELADDIDRRSPIIRSSSPRAKTASSSITQPKYITTPTKGLMILSPRNLCSPGYKSSKKCLISEMSQEPRPIPKDCVYPALVSCSTPVEAVLPQITSNMWPRGFGHLVRARNIKTVGDLSALTPSEIKNLPIRSPKISNVKTALKTYHEQQRKGRSDELKSFEEMENMTSELEEPTLPQNQEEEDKTPGEALTTEMLDEPVSMEQGPEERPDHQRPEGDLLLEVESLGARLAEEELSRCSPDQLVQLHDQLGGMMKNVVVQLQSRLLSQNKDSGP